MRARVWNDNVHPHIEMFKEKRIEIAAGGFIEMDYEEAIEFKSSFTVPVTDGEKNPIPMHFKKIRVETGGAPATVLPLICHATGKIASSPEELAKMNAEHVGMLDTESAAELEAAARLKAENDELKAKIAALEAAAAKPGPGRPRKTA